MSVTILLADDHKIVRDGLRNLLETQPDFRVISEAENGRATVRMVNTMRPDIVIMDIAMPELNGIEAARHILGDHPKTKIIALSMHSDKRFVGEMLKAGASGYLLKHCAFDELIVAIRAVLRNKTYLSPGITDVVIEKYVRHPGREDSSVFSLLSSREREVLQLLAEGRSTRQISEKLHVSVKTVEAHRTHVMTKLDIHNIAQLTKYAIREGLTSL